MKRQRIEAIKAESAKRRSALLFSEKTIANDEDNLYMAIKNQRSLATIIQIIKIGANVNGDFLDGCPLGIAVIKNYNAAIELLLQLEANPNKGPYSFLPKAIDNRNIYAVSILLKYAAATKSYFIGECFIRQALERNFLPAVDLLLAYGATFTLDRQMCCAINNTSDIYGVLKIFAKYHIDLNSKCNDKTILDYALEARCYSLVQALIILGVGHVARAETSIKGIVRRDVYIVDLNNMVPQQTEYILYPHDVQVKTMIPVLLPLILRIFYPSSNHLPKEQQTHLNNMPSDAKTRIASFFISDCIQQYFDCPPEVAKKTLKLLMQILADSKIPGLESFRKEKGAAIREFKKPKPRLL
jgi:hypothetical protein